jgi:hypothetical protein
VERSYFLVRIVTFASVVTEKLLLHNIFPHFRHYLSEEKTVKVVMDQITDAELVAKVRLGDKEAFGLLVERDQQMVGHIAKKMIANEWVARELAQRRSYKHTSRLII